MSSGMSLRHIQLQLTPLTSCHSVTPDQPTAKYSKVLYFTIEQNDLTQNQSINNSKVMYSFLLIKWMIALITGNAMEVRSPFSCGICIYIPHVRFYKTLNILAIVAIVMYSSNSKVTSHHCWWQLVCPLDLSLGFVSRSQKNRLNQESLSWHCRILGSEPEPHRRHMQCESFPLWAGWLQSPCACTYP